MKTKEELNDSELEIVNGGTTATKAEIDGIKETINALYGFVPEEIRNKIIEAYEKYGKKAAKALAQQLTKNHPTWAGIADLLA